MIRYQFPQFYVIVVPRILIDQDFYNLSLGFSTKIQLNQRKSVTERKICLHYINFYWQPLHFKIHADA